MDENDRTVDSQPPKIIDHAFVKVQDDLRDAFLNLVEHLGQDKPQGAGLGVMTLVGARLLCVAMTHSAAYPQVPVDYEVADELHHIVHHALREFLEEYGAWGS